MVAELLEHLAVQNTEETISAASEIPDELPLLNPVQMPVLQAVGNLYLQKQILFDH